MSGRKAKMLRRSVYNDYAIRERRYSRTTAVTLIADPLRRTYQDMKRQYKAGLI